MEDELKICIVCGKEIKRNDRYKYCSPECRQASMREKHTIYQREKRRRLRDEMQSLWQGNNRERS